MNNCPQNQVAAPNPAPQPSTIPTTTHNPPPPAQPPSPPPSRNHQNQFPADDNNDIYRKAASLKLLQTHPYFDNFDTGTPSKCLFVGGGAFGGVWMVFHKIEKKFHAVKICWPQDDSKKRAICLTESDLARRMVSNPNGTNGTPTTPATAQPVAPHNAATPTPTPPPPTTTTTATTTTATTTTAAETTMTSNLRGLQLNVPEFYGSCFDPPNDHMFIDMEYIESVNFQRYVYFGSSREELVRTLHLKKQMSSAMINAIGAQLLQSVHHLHSNGICHNDLKLENLLLECWREPTQGLATGPDDCIPIVKLIDFGLAQVCSQNQLAQLPVNGLIPPDFPLLDLCPPGTPLSMSPEKLGAYNAVLISGRQADLYAVGLILLHLIYGFWPHALAHSSKQLEWLRASATLDDFTYHYHALFGENITHQLQQGGAQPDLWGKNLRSICGPELHEALSILLNRRSNERHLVYETDWFKNTMIDLEPKLLKYCSHRWPGVAVLDNWLGRGNCATDAATTTTTTNTTTTTTTTATARTIKTMPFTAPATAPATAIATAPATTTTPTMKPLPVNAQPQPPPQPQTQPHQQPQSTQNLSDSTSSSNFHCHLSLQAPSTTSPPTVNTNATPPVIPLANESAKDLEIKSLKAKLKELIAFHELVCSVVEQMQLQDPNAMGFASLAAATAASQRKVVSNAADPAPRAKPEHKVKSAWPFSFISSFLTLGLTREGP